MIEFPGIEDKDLRQLVYDEFGRDFLKKSMEVQTLIKLAI
jgi:hypothetical protein